MLATVLAGVPPRPHKVGDILVPGLWFAGTMLAGAFILMVVIAWRKRYQRTLGTGASVEDQLAQFRALRDRGQLTPEEFEQVNAKLLGQLRSAGGPPAPPVPGEGASSQLTDGGPPPPTPAEPT
jgi:hypothetical protein